MTLSFFMVILPVLAWQAVFAVLVVRAPVVESERERGLRVDREVEFLDGCWYMPAYCDGIHG